MKLTRCCRALFLSQIALFFLAVILDDMAVLSVSICGFLIIAVRLVWFLDKAGITARSVKITRTIARSSVRQGKHVPVTVSIEITVPLHCTAQYREIPPDSCSLDPQTPITGIFYPGETSCILEYTAIPLIHGSGRFPGGMLTVSDFFCEHTIIMTGPAYAGPEIRVLPYPLFSHPGIDREARELERIGPVQGFGIRSLREYVPGDDLRYVDWKISAKRGRLFIREYTTQEEGQPMVIVDLPDRDQPYDSEGFLRLVGNVCGVIESTINMKNPISLLLISGPNFPDISYEGRDLPGFMAVLREQLHPQVRLHHQYRRQSRLSLRGKFHQWDLYNEKDSGSAESEDQSAFISRMKQVSGKHLLFGGVSTFQEKMARFLGIRRIRELTLYSLCHGDVSHIREIAALADQRNIRFRVLIPVRKDLGENGIRQELRGIRVGLF